MKKFLGTRVEEATFGHVLAYLAIVYAICGAIYVALSVDLGDVKNFFGRLFHKKSEDLVEKPREEFED